MSTQSRGYSLIEMIVVGAVLTVIAAIATPNLRSFLQAHQAAAVAASFHTELNLARQIAIARGTRTVLCRSEDGIRCSEIGPWSDGFLIFGDENGNNRLEANEPVLRHHVGSDAKNIRLHIGDGRRHIAFRPDGRGGGTNLTAVVCDRDGRPHRTVVISVAGRVRMGKPGPTTRCH